MTFSKLMIFLLKEKVDYYTGGLRHSNKIIQEKKNRCRRQRVKHMGISKPGNSRHIFVGLRNHTPGNSRVFYKKNVNHYALT